MPGVSGGAGGGLLAALAGAVGPSHALARAAIPARHLQDGCNGPPCAPLALVRPADTEQVAAVVRLCAAAKVPMVVQGGLTGLAGGAHPLDGEVIVALDRMAAIEAVDPLGRTLTAQAGATLQSVQEAAREAGLFYPVDLGSRGSCTIGGNVATNAGGVQVLRYGMTRRQVLGIEAVLADGRVITGMNRLAKNNTGYDWKEILIGSEGTLGVITRVVVALQPEPRGVQTALCACEGLDAAFALQRRLDDAFPGTLLAFEAMWRRYLEITRPALEGPVPFATLPPLALLVEVSGHGGSGDSDALAEVLASALEEGLITDALLARSLAERQRFWHWREINSAFSQLQPPGIHFDVSLPQARMAAAVTEWEAIVATGQPGGALAIYGHLGDGNLHVAVFPPAGVPVRAELAGRIYATVARLEGSVSAEHGIGTRRKAELPLSRTPGELALMQGLKSLFDPDNILGRGRIL